MEYSQPQTLIDDDEYESSNMASQKEIFLVISHYGAIQCMHGPHCH